ncbi:hypothetical protein AB0M29_38770 [Streptomyces sp. NPDC051976]|uniref:AbiTii domain-containing protein n=1 Tax=Streptomyces sp. NPDC051976 TaxID=3154947 RepID=UPI0034463729
MPSRTFQAAITTLPAGATALFEHSALDALAPLVLCSVLAGLLGLAPVVVHWCADQPRRERERIVNQALRDVAQADPERALVWRAQLPPLASPFEREPSSAEGPAPPTAVAPPGDPQRAARTGRDDVRHDRGRHHSRHRPRQTEAVHGWIRRSCRGREIGTEVADSRGTTAIRQSSSRRAVRPVGRQEEAIRVADELLADIELKRLKASEVVLKASRLARLVGHTELTEFLGFERDGYPSDGSAAAWIERAGRWAEQEKKTFYTLSIAKVEAQAEAFQQAIDALRGGGNYSGDKALLASCDHDTRIVQSSANLGVWTGICGQVVATVYGMVTEIYHELLFSQLQASLFGDTQEAVAAEGPR